MASEVYTSVLGQTEIATDIALSGQEAEEVVWRYIAGVEQDLSRVCRPYGRLYLLAALQSLLPEGILDPPPGYEADRQELFNLTAVAAFKHGMRDAEVRVGLSPTAYHEELCETNDISRFTSCADDIGRLWVLTQQYESALKAARCVGKGAEIVFPSASCTAHPGPVVHLDDVAREMVDLYDERVIRDFHLLPQTGYPAPILADAPLVVPMAQIDFNAYRGGRWPAPPRVGPVSLYASYLATLMRNWQVIERFGRRLHTEELFCFHSGILAPVLERLELGECPSGVGGCYVVHRSELCEALSLRGPQLYADLITFTAEVLPEEMPVDFILESFSRDYWAEIADPLIDEFSYRLTETDCIDLAVVGHAPTSYLFEVDDDCFFIHLGLVQWTMQTMWSRFEDDGREGETRGRTFERELAANIADDRYVILWPLRKGLPAVVRGKHGTDADVFIGLNDVAFLVECKSRKRTQREHRGEIRACWSRWEDVRGWLSDVESLAAWIAQHPSDCDLPECIEYVVPMVCSGTVEYIWTPEDRFFLPGEQPEGRRTTSYRQPRIATLEELHAYLQDLDDDGLAALRIDPSTCRVAWQS